MIFEHDRAAIVALYARSNLLIDTGEADGRAGTLASNGVFHHPAAGWLRNDATPAVAAMESHEGPLVRFERGGRFAERPLRFA